KLLPTENRTGKAICSRTRRTPRDKLRPINGIAPTRAHRQLSPRPGRAITNSGPQLAASTMSTAIGICSALVRQSKNLRLGSARVSRAGERVLAIANFLSWGKTYGTSQQDSFGATHLQRMRSKRQAFNPARETRGAMLPAPAPECRRAWEQDEARCH